MVVHNLKNVHITSRPGNIFFLSDKCVREKLCAGLDWRHLDRLMIVAQLRKQMPIREASSFSSLLKRKREISNQRRGPPSAQLNLCREVRRRRRKKRSAQSLEQTSNSTLHIHPTDVISHSEEAPGSFNQKRRRVDHFALYND